MALGVIAPQAPAFFRSLAAVCGYELYDAEYIRFFDQAAIAAESPVSAKRDQFLQRAVINLGQVIIQNVVRKHACAIFEGSGLLTGDVRRDSSPVGTRQGSLAVGHGGSLEVLSRRKQAAVEDLFPELLSPAQRLGYLPHTLSQWAAAKLLGSFFDASGKLQPTSFNFHSALQVFLPSVWERSLGQEATRYVDGFSATALRTYEDQVWDASQEQIHALKFESFQFPDSLLLTHLARESEVPDDFYGSLLPNGANAKIVAVYRGAVRFYQTGGAGSGLPSGLHSLFHYLHPDVPESQWIVAETTKPDAAVVRYGLPLQLAQSGAVQFRPPSIENAVTKPFSRVDADGVVARPIDDGEIITLMVPQGGHKRTLHAATETQKPDSPRRPRRGTGSDKK